MFTMWFSQLVLVKHLVRRAFQPCLFDVPANGIEESEIAMLENEDISSLTPNLGLQLKIRKLRNIKVCSPLILYFVSKTKLNFWFCAN